VVRSIPPAKIDEAAHLEKLEDRIRSRDRLAAFCKSCALHDLSESDAFTLVRQTAMRHRMTIEQLSAENHCSRGMPNRTTRTA